MIAQKTYVIPGLNSAKLIFYLNGSNAKFHVEFSGGSTFNNVPASFTTTDPACQAAIESDPGFGKRILISAVYYYDEEGERQPDSPRPEPEPEPETEPTSVDSVTDINSARKYLKDTYGVSGKALMSKEAIKKVMLEYNVTFPNFNLE